MPISTVLTKIPPQITRSFVINYNRQTKITQIRIICGSKKTKNPATIGKSTRISKKSRPTPLLRSTSQHTCRANCDARSRALLAEGVIGPPIQFASIRGSISPSPTRSVPKGRRSVVAARHKPSGASVNCCRPVCSFIIAARRKPSGVFVHHRGTAQAVRCVRFHGVMDFATY
jgi:hypothetical protein